MTRAPKKNIRLQSAAAATSATSHPGGMSMALPPVIAKAGEFLFSAYCSLPRLLGILDVLFKKSRL